MNTSNRFHHFVGLLVKRGRTYLLIEERKQTEDVDGLKGKSTHQSVFHPRTHITPPSRARPSPAPVRALRPLVRRQRRVVVTRALSTQETWMYAFLNRVSVMTRRLAIQSAQSAKEQLECHSLNFKLKGFEFDDKT